MSLDHLWTTCAEKPIDVAATLQASRIAMPLQTHALKTCNVTKLWTVMFAYPVEEHVLGVPFTIPCNVTKSDGSCGGFGILLSLRTGCPAGAPAGEGNFVTCLPLEAIGLHWSLIRNSALEAHALLGPGNIQQLDLSASLPFTGSSRIHKTISITSH